MSAYPKFLTATPRVTRMEMADLYAGDAATVVQLDATPCETWIQNLQGLVSRSPALSGTRVEVDGSWVHFLGVRKKRGPVAPYLLEVIAAAGEMAYAPAAVRPTAFSAPPTPAMQ
jgi:hypothetical protein